jgi:hypothetical protein
MSLPAKRFSVFIGFPKPCLIAFLKPYGSTCGFPKASWGVYRFPRGFKQAIYNSHTALKQLLPISARGFKEISENSKAFCKR